MNTFRPAVLAARRRRSMFSAVLLRARLSLMSPKALPCGARKSLCRSVNTSAVAAAFSFISGVL
jgi:hypothetical protein